MSDPTNVTNIFSAIIKSLDKNSGDTFITRSNGDPSVDCIAGQYTQRLKLNGPASQTNLPAVFMDNVALGVDQLYIKNLDPNANVTVKWKVGAAASVVVYILPPGGMLVMWNTSVIPGSQLNTITCASDVGGTYIEVFQGVISSFG